MAEAALAATAAVGADLIVSRVALGKEALERPTLAHRLDVLFDVAATRPWLDVVVTDARLLADIAEGYGWLLIGGDKWTQINELRWYDDSASLRLAALARLPALIVVGRDDHDLPDDAIEIRVPEALGVSSTGVRAGNWSAATNEARAFARRTGAWIDHARYERYLDRDRSGC